MKKFCFFILVLIFTCLFVGCGLKKQMETCISEKDELLFSGEDENFFVTLCIGKRENPYVVNGESSQLIDFAVLTAYKKGNNQVKNDVSFELNVSGQSKSGKFEVNPFDGSFVVDLLSVGENLQDVFVKIFYDEQTCSINLQNALAESDLTSTQALNIGINELKKVESEIVQNGKVNGEIYVRIMQNQGQVPLWYVSLITKENKLFALIIDPKTKQVIAKNF